MYQARRETLLVVVGISRVTHYMSLYMNTLVHQSMHYWTYEVRLPAQHLRQKQGKKNLPVYVELSNPLLQLLQEQAGVFQLRAMTQISRRVKRGQQGGGRIDYTGCLGRCSKNGAMTTT